MIELTNGELGWLPGKLSSEKLKVMKDIIMEQSSGVISGKLFCVEKEDVISALPKRVEYSHKGSYGKLLIIAGSKNMAGASVLSARAALRMGTGLVKVLAPEDNRLILQTAVPEAILGTYEKTIDPDQLAFELDWADAVVIGPGLGQSQEANSIFTYVWEFCRKPLLLDADALNLLAKLGDYHVPDCPVALTPHFGEMARLSGKNIDQIRTTFFETAGQYARNHLLVLHLKHAKSLTAFPDGSMFFNPTGNSGMATAGSGDVLSGIIGALLAQGVSVPQAVYCGAYIHGDCGDKMAELIGKRGLIASDLISGLTKLEYLK